LECQVDGAPRCVYVVRWPRWRRLRMFRSRAYLSEQVASLTAQVDSLQSIAADLVSSKDTGEVLDQIVRRAADTVRAQRYILAVRTREGAPIEVHADGFDVEAARTIGEDLLTTQCGRRADDEHAIVIDVASARQDYGRLAVFYDDHPFFENDRRLLAAYARS